MLGVKFNRGFYPREGRYEVLKEWETDREKTTSWKRRRGKIPIKKEGQKNKLIGKKKRQKKKLSEKRKTWKKRKDSLKNKNPLNKEATLGEQEENPVKKNEKPVKKKKSEKEETTCE